MSKTPSEPKNLLLQIMALMIILLLATAVYHALRPGIGRLTADFFYPYLKVSRVAVNSISDRTLLSFSRAELAAKLEQQQKLNETLAFQAAAAEELLRENHNLRRYLGMKVPEQWDYLVAEIMLRDPLLWLEHFTIDRGTADGVEQGDAVIDVSENGTPLLVGVIGNCGKHNAEVMTVFNPDFCFSAGIGSRFCRYFGPSPIDLFALASEKPDHRIISSKSGINDGFKLRNPQRYKPQKTGF